MSELRSFTALQARVYEFLEKQDEDTLRAIISGEQKLAVLRTDEAQALAGSAPRGDAHSAPQPPADPSGMPSSDSSQAAHDLPGRPAEQAPNHVNLTGLRVDELKKIAKQRGLVGYSKLNRAELINLLGRPSPDQAPAAEPTTPAPSGPAAVQRTSSRATAPSSADAVAIAVRLRETETEDEGAAYLQEQRLDREGLLAVAAELQLTRVERLSQKELRRRVLKQAIGARRKFAGLRKW
jgi:hypothetical protein